MEKLLRSTILFCAFVAMTVLPARGQVTAPPAADSDATTAGATPTGQAPDDVMKKLSDIVRAGKYAEAQQLTTGLLLAYPDDQRLIKAKALLDKSLASSKLADPAAIGNPPANNVSAPQPATNMKLTGMDKVEYNSLIELARQAQQTTDLEQQTASLKQFMDRSSSFLQKYPDQMLLWQLRAFSALSLNDLMAGYEAGQRLLASGAADSNDQNLQQLLSKLNLRGWLDKEKVEAWRKQQADAAEAARLKAETDKYTFGVARGHGLSSSPGRMTINENNAVYEGSDNHIEFSKSDVRELTYDPYLLRFALKDGKSFTFVPDNYFDPQSRASDLVEKISLIMNAVVERWSFMPTDGNRSLVPNKKKTFKPTTPN